MMTLQAHTIFGRSIAMNCPANQQTISCSDDCPCSYAEGLEQPHYPVPALMSHYTWPWEWSFGYRVVQFENRGMRAFYY